MYNRFLSFLLLPSLYAFLFVTSFGSDLYGMSDKTLSADRQAWLLKARQEVPKNMKTMNDGVEETAITVFKALANDDYKEMDDQATTYNLNNAVKAASQVASRVRIMSEDSSESFKPEWQSKKRTTKYAKDTVALLNDPKKDPEYSGKRLSVLKKKYAKGKEQPSSARWAPTKLPENTTENVFWNPSAEITNQDDVGYSLRRLGREVFENSKDIDKQNKKFAEKEKKVKKLKEANLVWKREDGKQSKQETDDGKEHCSEKRSKENNDEVELITEQQFSDSFAKIIAYHNYALARAAFHMKELPNKKKDIPNMLHCLYRAQAVKNALFSLPEYYEAKNKKSKFYVDMKHLGLADDLYIVHRFLADEKKHKLINKSLSTREWIVDSCRIGKIVLDDLSTIKSFFKQDSMEVMLNTEMMKKYVTDQRTLMLLGISSKCVDFFDKHTFLKALISPFGCYLLRPTLKGILSFTANRLTSKKEEEKPSSLQNNLDGFALSLKEEHQHTRKASDVHNETEGYIEFLLKRTQLKDDSIAIPLSKDKAKKLREENQEKLTELEKEIKIFERYCSTGYKITQEDKQLFETSHNEKEELRAQIKRANYWLRFHGEKVEKSKDSVVTPIDTVSRNYEQRKKELCEQNFKLYEADLYDPDKTQKELRKEARTYGDLLRKSKIFYTPEEFLFPDKDDKKQIKAFIKKCSDEYRHLLTVHEDLLAVLGISTETFLSLYVKARLNKECGALISHYENVQEKFIQKVHERRHLEGEQIKIKKESETFAKRSFRTPKRFFSLIYSFFVNKYNQWRMSRNEYAQKQVNDEIEALRMQLRELERHKEYKAFEQMFRDKNHTRYVQDTHLEEKVKILKSRCDTLFEYALWPDKRVKKQSASEIVEKRKHKLPKFKTLKLLPDYDDIEHVKVQRQKGAQCALYALLNGIAFCNNDADFTKNHLGECRLLVKKMRLAAQIKLELFRNREMKLCVSQDDEYTLHEIMLQIKGDDARLETIDCDWLEPVESQRLKRLLSEDLKTEFNNIIFITDTSWYLNGSATIKLDEARKVQALQNALNNEEDCRFGIHLNTFCSSNEKVDDGGHYIALLIEKKDGVITYRIANSYQEISSRDVFNNFMKLLWHYDFKNIVSKDSENKIEDCLRRLDFRKVFIDKKLNQNLHNTIENVMENDKDLIGLINWVLKGAKKLFDLTHGEALWTHDGFKDTKAVILDTLDAIEKAHNQSIMLYPEGKQKFIILTDNQKERINVLRKNLEDMRD